MSEQPTKGECVPGSHLPNCDCYQRPNTAAEAGILREAEQLRDFIREKSSGGCRMLSQGDQCQCPLCAVDRLVAEVQRLRAAQEQLQHDLARCYEQTGADPDGNEDWRLAGKAVREVTRFRVEFDELQAANLALMEGLRNCLKAKLAALRIAAAQP